MSRLSVPISRRTLVTEFDEEGEVSSRIKVSGDIVREGKGAFKWLHIDSGDLACPWDDRDHLTIPVKHLDELIEMLKRTKAELSDARKEAANDLDAFFEGSGT